MYDDFIHVLFSAAGGGKVTTDADFNGLAFDLVVSTFVKVWATSIADFKCSFVVPVRMHGHISSTLLFKFPCAGLVSSIGSALIVIFAYSSGIFIIILYFSGRIGISNIIVRISPICKQIGMADTELNTLNHWNKITIYVEK